MVHSQILRLSFYMLFDIYFFISDKTIFNFAILTKRFCNKKRMQRLLAKKKTKQSLSDCKYAFF